MMAPRGKRGILGLKVPGAWPERWATKDPRGTEACLDLEDPKVPWGNPESRGPGETLGMLVPVETQDHPAPRETLADLDSATLDLEESPVTKASLAPEAPRAAEATSG